MKTVAELQEWLKQFDPASRVYAYEGEIVGIIVVDPNDNQLGAFEAPEYWANTRWNQ